MAKVIKFTISGHGADTDAPPAEDVLDQIRDYLDILNGVEKAASGSPGSAIIWRITDASRKSPLALNIEAFPKHFATNIDDLYRIVVRDTARGLEVLQSRAERPPNFTDDVMKKAHRAFERVTNGIGMSGADFGDDLPKITLTPTIARNAARNIQTVLASPDRPYQEIGSVEGNLNGIELDGFGRRVAHLTARVSGQQVKCIIPREATSMIRDLEMIEVRDIWRSRRVVVFGRIHFRSLGNIEHVIADGICFLRQRSELPQVDDIIDLNFTNGTRSEDYLEGLRYGPLP